MKEWLRECMVKGGLSEENGLPCVAPPALSNNWYLRDGNECVRECDDSGDLACNGRAPYDAMLYLTESECFSATS